MVVLEVVLHQKVGAEVVGRVAPNAVHVVGVVLGVIEFDEGDRALDSEVVGLVDGGATGPGEVQLSDSTGGRDAVHLEANQPRAGTMDKPCQ